MECKDSLSQEQEPPSSTPSARWSKSILTYHISYDPFFFILFCNVHLGLSADFASETLHVLGNIFSGYQPRQVAYSLYNHLTRLLAPEAFIEICPHDTFKLHLHVLLISSLPVLVDFITILRGGEEYKLWSPSEFISRLQNLQSMTETK